MPKKKGTTTTTRTSKGYTEEDFRAVASSVRSLWRLNSKIPTLEEIDAVCSASRIKIARVVSTEAFLDAMDITGVPMRKHKGLTSKQHYMLMILTEPSDKRPLQQRLRDASVTIAEYRAWLNNPIFKSFIEQFANKALGEHLHVAHNSLMNQVEKGDVRALTLYYEMTGIYDPRAKQERDITGVLAQVLEIIQRNVTDPEVLAGIADEMRALMGVPQPPKGLPAYRSEDVVDAEEVSDFDQQRIDKYETEGWIPGGEFVSNPSRALEEKLAQGGAAPGSDKLPSFMYVDKED